MDNLVQSYYNMAWLGHVLRVDGRDAVDRSFQAGIEWSAV